jgi:hypothetical protein
MLGEQIPLQQWSSFFSITAAASATLLGLLFVVITIAPGIGRQLASKSKVYLTPAVIYLSSVLIMSALLTIPNQTRLSAVICISIMCVFGLLYIGSLTVMRSEVYESRFDRYRYAGIAAKRANRSRRRGSRDGHVAECRNPEFVVNSDINHFVGGVRMDPRTLFPHLVAIEASVSPAKSLLRLANREVCDIVGSGTSDVGTDSRQQELDAVTGTHHLTATR